MNPVDKDKFHELEKKCLEDVEGKNKEPVMQDSRGLCGCFQSEDMDEVIDCVFSANCPYASDEIKPYFYDKKTRYGFRCRYRKNQETKKLWRGAVNG